VELLFLPSVDAPCPTCHGARFNAKTLEIKIRDKSVADVLGMTVDTAYEFFAEDTQTAAIVRGHQGSRPGLHPATELSGGEAQRVKLATELHQRATWRNSLYPR
jgi:excinuclease ABC subunit A